MIVGTLPKPWEAPDDSPDAAPGGGGEGRDRDRVPARAREAPEPAPTGAQTGRGAGTAASWDPHLSPTTTTDSDDESGGGLPARWCREASDTATAAVDGAVWRSRPPALRDLHARAMRAEWAGSVPLLKLAGQVFFWLVALPTHVAGYGLLWLARRPTRLLVTLVVVLITVLTIAF